VSKGVSITIKGLKELKAEFEQGLQRRVMRETDKILAAGALKYEQLAVNAAPHDEGLLRQMIKAEKVKALDYAVVSGAPHSAAMEFGTRRKVKVPSDLASYAAQFKGKPQGGDYYDFLNAILDWVIRKGIASTYSTGVRKNKGRNAGYSYDASKKGRKNTKKEDAVRVAHAIALSIQRNGVNPQPYFFQHRQTIAQFLQQQFAQLQTKIVKK
jgi:hypothetical protein